MICGIMSSITMITLRKQTSSMRDRKNVCFLRLYNDAKTSSSYFLGLTHVRSFEEIPPLSDETWQKLEALSKVFQIHFFQKHIKYYQSIVVKQNLCLLFVQPL